MESTYFYNNLKIIWAQSANWLPRYLGCRFLKYWFERFCTIWWASNEVIDTYRLISYQGHKKHFTLSCIFGQKRLFSFSPCFLHPLRSCYEFLLRFSQCERASAPGPARRHEFLNSADFMNFTYNYFFILKLAVYGGIPL